MVDWEIKTYSLKLILNRKTTAVAVVYYLIKKVYYLKTFYCRIINIKIFNNTFII